MTQSAAQPQVPTTSSPTLTVALCTHNHGARLRITLNDLRHLHATEDKAELLIVDNASTDDTGEILREFPWGQLPFSVRIVKEMKLGLSNARNRAIKEARGDYILFMDDDETADPNWLCAYDSLIRQYSPDMAGGPIRVRFENCEKPVWVTDDLLGFLGELDHNKPTTRAVDESLKLFGGNFAFKRSVFEQIGRFDPDLGRTGTTNTGGEDTDMFFKVLNAGCSIYWTPDAIIHHRIDATKLTKRYFHNLHYLMGCTAGIRQRGNRSRTPPLYIYPQLWRAALSVIRQRRNSGKQSSVRKEMNVAYFLGVIRGWLASTKESIDQ